jgi:OOP family OmpA-OmpF porin
MRKILIIVLMLTGLTVWGINTAGAVEIITADVIEKKILTEIDFIKNADNFIIMFDSSKTMQETLPGTNKSKLTVAKGILKLRNELLPDLGFTAGLYLYTRPFRAIYSAQRYDRARFREAIDQLPDEAEGRTDLKKGLHEMRTIIAGLSGKTVVFLFSDGKLVLNTVGNAPKEIARQIAEKNNVSFYVISSATGEAEKRLLEAVSSINASSRVIPLEAFLYNPGYVSGALFDILETAIVKLSLVEKVVGFVMDDILFDFNSADIKPEYVDKLDKLGHFLKDNPSAFVVMDGYSDNVGPGEASLWVSRYRVTSVEGYLVKHFDIDSLRIVPMWYGELNPTADNSSANGRVLNRRVEIAVGGL